MTESNAWVLLVPTGCWLASRAAEWAVGQCVGYRYWGPRGALFSNLGVPAAACIVAAALLAVFPPTLSRAKRTVVQWIVVVGLIASTHWAAARLRWVEGYYVLPRGTDVRSMSPGALVAAWLDSANVELRGSAKMELEERGASVADAVAERVERWKRAKGAKYLQEGPVLAIAQLLADIGDRRAIPILFDIAGAAYPECGIDVDEGQRSSYLEDRPRVLMMLNGVYGLDVSKQRCPGRTHGSNSEDVK